MLDVDGVCTACDDGDGLNRVEVVIAIGSTAGVYTRPTGMTWHDSRLLLLRFRWLQPRDSLLHQM